MTSALIDPARRFAEAQVAHLATITAQGAPHLVPVVFGIVGDTIYSAVDAKRKSTQQLQRLANIEAHPRVCLMVDHYDDDWSQLWWVRADGVATVHRAGEGMAVAYQVLREKYPQYERISLNGPAITIEVRRWSSWSA